MAEKTNGKRKLPEKVLAMKARKTQRLQTSSSTAPAQVAHDEPQSNANKKRASSSKNTAVPSQKRRKLGMGAVSQKVDPNSLAWKEVELPDRMDDWEGIYQIDEVDDVEVVREGDKVSFQAKVAAKTRPLEDFSENDEDDDDAESFNGFDDEPTVSRPKDIVHNVPELVEKDAIKPEESEKLKKKEKTREKAKAKEKTQAKKTQFSTANDVDSKQATFEALAKDSDDSAVDVTAWRPLKLCPDTMAALAALKFSKPTAIQKEVIPEVLAGHDVIGKASTGSGKTLAFGVPILERFLESAVGADGKRAAQGPLALILSPTRELAHQLDQHLTALCSSGLSRRPWIATLTGGLSLQKQQRQLRDADIVVATPGRLWEIISSGRGIAASLRQIEFLVIDEADRLLSEGQFKEVEEILNSLDREDEEEGLEEGEEAAKNAADSAKAERQTLVFSATFDRALQKKLVGKVNRQTNLMGSKESMEYLLGKLNFREEEPKFIDANPVNQLATGLKEGLIECSGTEKDLYLYALLLLNSASRAMVFTNSISAVRRITPLLQYLNINVMALHSGMPQKARLRSIERFSQKNGSGRGQRSVLIATDVAARGLDIKNVDLVVHYHLPRTADTYVHRSGRTARAGQQGSSILICGPEEVAGVRRLVAKVHAHSAATKEDGTAAKQGYYIRTLDIDRRVVSRLRDRAALAKKLADATIAKEKQHKEDDFMRSAAEELGVDYDSEEFEKEATGKRGRGNGRKKKEREARELTKNDLGAMKAELKQLLRERVNVGVSEKYLTSGRVDINELLRQQDEGAGKTGEFLGHVGNLGLDDL